jgi:hypothetical protein
MSTIINATTTNGVVIQPDNSGSLVLQTNSGTTALTIDTSQRAAFVAGTAALPAITTTGDTNTGIFFSAADTIDFAEGGTACGQFDSSANFKFNSGYGSVVTAYGCRAWVNFNGTGTVAIRGSGNVSSITDNGTGLYTVNFTIAMPDANYGFCIGFTEFAAVGTNYALGYDDITYTTTALGLRSQVATGAEIDMPYASVSIFR